MSTILEELGVQTHGLIEEMLPFETWEGSPVKDWQVTMQMLTMGDLIDVAKLTGNVSPLEMSYLTKVHLLSKCLKAINGRELANAEELEAYNKLHNFTGTMTTSLLGYKILYIKQLSEAVVSRLAFLYDEMSNRYVAALLGKAVIPDELDATSFNGAEGVSDESDSPTATS